MPPNTKVPVPVKVKRKREEVEIKRDIRDLPDDYAPRPIPRRWTSY